MAGKYVYKNMNPYPLVLPGPRGVGVTFREGEGSTHEWFSRFVGSNRLTRVPVDESDLSGIVNVPGVPQSQKAEDETMSPEKAKEILAEHTPWKVDNTAEEHTKDYVKKSGIYHCKHCDTFRTGHLGAMQDHVSGYHQMEPEAAPSESQTVTRSPEVEMPDASVTTQIPEGAQSHDVELGDDADPVPQDQADVEEEQSEVETQVSEESEEPKSEAHECEFCGRKFKSLSGLKSHQRAKHEDE